MAIKRLCGIMAAAMIFASIPFYGTAAEVDKEESTTKNLGTIKFDIGDWDPDDRICFYIYDTTDGTYCSKNGWSTYNEWGSKKLRGTQLEDKENIIESYEIDFRGKEDHNVFVIFHDTTTGMHTYDCVLTPEALGHTAYMTGNQMTVAHVSSYDNYEVNEKNFPEVVFEGVDSGICGPYKHISATGRIVGYCPGPADNGAAIVAIYVFNSYGIIDKSGEECCTAEKVADAIAAFNTTSDDVWNEFLKFRNRDRYYSIEEGAKKLINPSSNDDSSNLSRAAGVNGLVGDIDRDKELSANDALLILRASVGLENFDIFNFMLADVDSDKSITSNDAFQVLRVSVDLPSDSIAGIQNSRSCAYGYDAEGNFVIYKYN